MKICITWWHKGYLKKFPFILLLIIEDALEISGFVIYVAQNKKDKSMINK
jgi:hypothetical protein